MRYSFKKIVRRIQEFRIFLCYILVIYCLHFMEESLKKATLLAGKRQYVKFQSKLKK